MKINFTYDIDRDVENFTKGVGTFYGSGPGHFHDLFTKEVGGEFLEDKERVKEFILKHLQENNLDTNQKKDTLEANWKKIETEFLSRCKKIFGVEGLDSVLTVYLTTSNRCTYNPEENYFFVNMNSVDANRTVMHEILHLFTHSVFEEYILKKGLSADEFHDIKESLTELLNIEFRDLMGRSIDGGYEPHKDLRTFVKNNWESGGNIKDLIDKMIGEVERKREVSKEINPMKTNFKV